MEISDVGKIIKELVRSGKIPGAFVFEGDDEENKRIITEVLAKSLVCGDGDYKKRNGEGCGACASCKKADMHIHPDIIVAKSDGEGSLSLHIDKARDIVSGLYLAPNESETKVYIIENMQDMTPQGQNALLKSLEEPPPFAVFIITASDKNQILETVKSRAINFTVGSGGKTAQSQRNPKLHEELVLDILAQKPDKLATYQKLLSKALDKSGKNEVLNFYSCLEEALRDILVAKLFDLREAPGIKNFSFLCLDFEKTKNLANTYSTNKILNLSKTISGYKADLDYNVNVRLNLTSFFASISLI